MRRAIIITLILLSFARLDPHRAKGLIRRITVALSQWTLRLFSRPYRMGFGTTVIFAPHQDDETLGCGGLIARKRVEGIPVHVIFITDGNASHPGHPTLTPEKLAILRKQEAREALAILGVESLAIHFLDEADGSLNHLPLERREALVNRIAGLLREIGAEEIFLPCSPDGSSEHDAAFDFVSDAVERLPGQPVLWQYPVWAWWNPVLIVSKIILAANRCRVPTEDYKLLKSRALACYRSQLEPLAPQPKPALPPELVRIFQTDVEYFFRFRRPGEVRRFVRGKEPPAI